MVEGLASSEQRAAFVDAVEAALRPLMPVALAYGVTYSDLLEMLRGLFITAVHDRLAQQGRPTTYGRIGLMTGINRGLVEKILQDRQDATARGRATAERVSNLAMVLTAWHDDPRFCTPYGAPLDLSLQPDGGFRAFDELLRVACPTGDADAVLDELVASGCVEVHEGKFVRCTSRVYIPVGGNVERIARLGVCVGGLNGTFAHNLLRQEGERPYFERVIQSDFPLSDSGREQVLDYLRDEGWAFLDRSDRWMSERQPTLTSSVGGNRCGISVFFFDLHNEPSAHETAAVASN